MAPTYFIESKQDLSFRINGKIYSLDGGVPVTTTLLQFIREVALLPGTKALCGEGGCGACTVVASVFSAESNSIRTFSVRACQTLVYSCVGWSVKTIEHLGDRYVGYDRLQTALRGFYGTQCGYCTPGFVMTMQGTMASSKGLKMERIEKVLDGNICRCTGYRPILDAFKSLATDAPKVLTSQLADIEDAYQKRCEKAGKPCEGHDCLKSGNCLSDAVEISQSLSCKRDSVQWHRPQTVQDVFTILNSKRSSEKVRIVVGNTSSGVFKNDGPFHIYIDITGIKELCFVDFVDSLLTIGANVSLERCIEVFQETAKKQKGYHHLEEIAKHWDLIANIGIRNVGCWSGNLMMKHSHPEFHSDIYLTLVAVEAKLKIGNSSSVHECSVEELMALDMSKSVILSMHIPPQPQNVKLRTFKIMPRAVNALAYVNAAFKFHLDPQDGFRVVNRPLIVLGGISPSFTHARKTEKFFVGKQLTNRKAISEVLSMFASEIQPRESLMFPSPKYQVSLCQSLLFKTILGLLGDGVSEKNRSGSENLKRDISCGQQDFDANTDSWPVGQGIAKLESEIQIAGEAEYTDDIQAVAGELYGAFVQSSVAKGKIKEILFEECLKIDDVVDVVTASDIPGTNNFHAGGSLPDPIFADSEVSYAGQPVALVIARKKTKALEGARLVRITYEDVIEAPVLTIEDALKVGRTKTAVNFFTGSLADPFVLGDAQKALTEAKHIVEGEFHIGTQFHFSMEPLAARVVPTEEGYDVYCTTQWASCTQNIVADALKIPAHCVNVYVRRLGGAFGGKISRPGLVATAAAVAARKVQRPVRVTIDLATHMTIVGWREPYYSKYKVGFTTEGKLEAVEVDMYSDCGFAENESSVTMVANLVPNTYYCPNWKIQPFSAFTDTAPNTWCRAPGHPEAIAIMENIIEHVSHFLKKDPVEIREKNFTATGQKQLFQVFEDNVVRNAIFPLLKTKSDYEARKAKVAQFNKEHRWKKRGISMIPLRYPFQYGPIFQYNAHVVIYEHDGTVAIKHGGIEMGQGINTKVAQVAAKILEVPMDLIRIKRADVFAGANSFVTGGSFGSEVAAHGVKICCERIKERMKPVQQKLNEENGNASWSELVKKCFHEQVDLCERYFTIPKEHPKSYDIWGAATSEVEIDVLTGQYLILRADIMEDCGRSLNPYVDIGQIEGAFVMGVGLYTTEKVTWNPKTGQKAAGTLHYEPPTALDIPVDMRVTLLPGAENAGGVLRSKATGEPAVCLSFVVVSALREAIASARAEAGDYSWFEMHAPITVEKIQQLCKVSPDQFEI